MRRGITARDMTQLDQKKDHADEKNKIWSSYKGNRAYGVTTQHQMAKSTKKEITKTIGIHTLCEDVGEAERQI